MSRDEWQKRMRELKNEMLKKKKHLEDVGLLPDYDYPDPININKTGVKRPITILNDNPGPGVYLPRKDKCSAALSFTATKKATKSQVMFVGTNASKQNRSETSRQITTLPVDTVSEKKQINGDNKRVYQTSHKAKLPSNEKVEPMNILDSGPQNYWKPPNRQAMFVEKDASRKELKESDSVRPMTILPVNTIYKWRPQNNDHKTVYQSSHNYEALINTKAEPEGKRKQKSWDFYSLYYNDGPQYSLSSRNRFTGYCSPDDCSPGPCYGNSDISRTLHCAPKYSFKDRHRPSLWSDQLQITEAGVISHF